MTAQVENEITGLYQDEVGGRGPYPSRRLSGPGQQVGPGLLQTVGDLGATLAETRDDLAQQQPQQLQGGVEDLSSGGKERDGERADV